MSRIQNRRKLQTKQIPLIKNFFKGDREKAISTAFLPYFKGTTGKTRHEIETISATNKEHRIKRIIREDIGIDKQPNNLIITDDSQHLPTAWKA